MYLKEISKTLLYGWFVGLSMISFSQETKKNNPIKSDSIVRQINALRQEASKLATVENALKAIEKLEHCLELYGNKEINDNTLLFGLYVDLSNLYGIESIRNEEKTLDYINKAKTLAEKTEVKTYDLINFYISLGANEYEESKISEALGYINIAYEFLEKRNKKLINEIGDNSEKKLRATLLEWFVTINFSFDKEDDLLKSHRKLERFYFENERNSDAKYYYALGSFRVGRFYQTKDATKAEFFFNKAEEKGDKNIKLYSIICKGFAFLGANNHSKIPSIIKKLEAFDNLNRFQELNLHEIASRYYSETKQIEHLIKHVNKALLLLNAKERPIDVLNFNADDFSPIIQLKYPILLNQFARFLEQSGNPKLVATSTELFKICLKQFDERIDRKPVNNHFVNYDIIRNRNLKWLIDTNASLDAKQAVLSKMERIDNRASLNRIIFNRTLAEKKSDLDSLLTRENKIREDITLLKQKQVEADTTMNQQLFELELQLKKLNEQLVEENPTIFGLNSTEFNLASVQLGPNTKILKYLKSEDNLFRISISNSDIKIDNLGVYTAVESNVTSFVDKIKSFEDYKVNSDTLFRQLLSNETFLEHTVIIADACLRYLPFELLTQNNEHLIEKTAISYARGLSYLNPDLYESQTYEENITLFAPSYKTFMPSEVHIAVRGEPYDLKGAIEEVNTIKDIIKGVVYKNESASKSKFLDMPNNSAILHLAGHAFLNDKDPELSSIVFSDHEEDNKLFISELYGFKSNAELAVLSACSTGIGGYDDGSGIVSLSEAFMFSGIPSTVSSLWSAPDKSTQEIMVYFYNYLNNGMTKSNALRNAKLDYLKQNADSKLTQPYYWAGFVLYGNDTPITLNKDVDIKYYIFFGLIVVLLLGLILWRKKSRIKS